MTDFPIQKEVVLGDTPAVAPPNNLPKEQIPVYAPPQPVNPNNPPV